MNPLNLGGDLMLFNNNNGIRYKNVTKPEELIGIIGIRHDRLVNQLKRITPEEVHDIYDGIGLNFFAYDENDSQIPVGAIRIVDEDDLKFIGQEKIKIKNTDIEPYRGDKNLLVERFLTSPTKSNGAIAAHGLFGCIYIYGYDYVATDLFIVANCEIIPGRIEIPKSYLRLGFKPIADIKRKHYDNFDTNSVPMHATREDLIGNKLKRIIFERYRKKIDFEFTKPEDRALIYKEAVKMMESLKPSYAREAVVYI